MQELLKGPPIPAKLAQKPEKDQEKVQEKAQAFTQTFTQTLTETGPAPPQTPPAAQNETKPDESFIKLQEKLRADGELPYEKINTIWALCKLDKKKGQIDDEIKEAYGEPQQKLVKRDTEAYEKSGGSEQALKELLKDLPIPAKFAQKTEKDQEKVQGSTQSMPQTPPKVPKKDLQKVGTKPQSLNLNTNQPPNPNSHFNPDFIVNFDSIFSEGFARSFPIPRSPLEEYVKAPWSSRHEEFDSQHIHHVYYFRYIRFFRDHLILRVFWGLFVF